MSKATLKFIRLSPIKARLITKQIQGMNAELALASLEFMPNKAAGIIAKVIASACANGDYEPEEVTILSARSDKGPVLKRFKPRARGSASRILKPTAHIMIEVGTVTDSKKAAKTTEKAKPAKKVEKKAKATKEVKATETKVEKAKSDKKVTESDTASKKTEVKAKATKEVKATETKVEKAKSDKKVTESDTASKKTEAKAKATKEVKATETKVEKAKPAKKETAKATKSVKADSTTKAKDSKATASTDIDDKFEKAVKAGKAKAATTKATAKKTEAKATKTAKKVEYTIDVNDLKLLSGIGPVMEKVIIAEGITSIEQVAKMTKKEIEELDAKVGIKGEIKDTWQAEAKDILKNNKKES